MKISIIHPSRQRPVKAFETYRHWVENAIRKDDIEYILSLDNDDIIQSYVDLFEGRTTLLIAPNRSAVDAVNVAAKHSTGDILIVVSDDFKCFNGWDEEIRKAVHGKTDFVLKTQDGTQDWIITLPIMCRKYYERFGYIYHPDYAHMFCDTELTHVADLLQKKITSKLVFPHEHYSIGAFEKDQVSIKADNTWKQGETVYLKRLKQNFGLAKHDIKGRITGQSHINWLRKKGIRA